MRFIHTSDWHLGRSLYGVRLLEDQAYILDRFVEMVEETSPDLVVIAGDVFDRAQPPRDSLALLDDVLKRVIVSSGVPVLMIAGNHDSAELIEFGARIAEKGRLYLSGVLGPEVASFTFEDEHGSVRFYMVPYADPPVVRERMSLTPEEVHDHDSAFQAISEAIRSGHPKGERSVIVAHAFVAGGQESTSERPLSVGGAGTVRAGHFDGFDYSCLGHLHRPQHVVRETIRYSGSILKYSASEIDHEKSATLVEIDADGRATVEILPLVPRRDFRLVEGLFADLYTGPLRGPREDYLIVNLLDQGPVMDAMARLREVYPNILHINRVRRAVSSGGGIGARDHRRIGTVELFEGFFEYVSGETLDEEQRKVFAEVAHAVESGGMEEI